MSDPFATHSSWSRPSPPPHVLAAAGPPSASADALPGRSGSTPRALSFTGTANNDVVEVSKLAAPGGWSSRSRSASGRRRTSRPTAPRAGHGDWHVSCPVSNVHKLTFDGRARHDSFNNNTNLPSVAHGGAGVEDFRGGAGADLSSATATMTTSAARRRR